MSEQTTTQPLTQDLTQDARAHVTAYYAGKGTVDFIRGTVWQGEHAAGQAKGMLLASMKSMDLALSALQRIKGALTEADWWTLCAQNHPLHLIENQALVAVEMVDGIRQAAAASGLPSAFAEGFITDLAKRLD